MTQKKIRQTPVFVFTVDPDSTTIVKALNKRKIQFVQRGSN